MAAADAASADSILASPPRAPLQVMMTDANNASNASAATSCPTSGSSSSAESPATPNGIYFRNYNEFTGFIFHLDILSNF